MGLLRASVAVVAAACLLGGGFWAGHRLAATPPVAESSSPSGYQVVEGSVEASVATTVTIGWSTSEQLDVPTSGRVTALPPSGVVHSGDVLLGVDGEPVIAVQGATPAYRALSRGDRGPDVAQLQRFLTSQGHAVDDDGMFGPATAGAVSAWTRSLGLPPSSSVPLGRIVFLASLPARVTPADTVRLGAEIPSPAIVVLASEPTVSATVNDRTAASAGPGTTVSFDLSGTAVTTTVSGPGPRDPSGLGSTVLLDPGPLHCEQTQCPGTVDHPAVLQGTLTTQPKVTGLVVPLAAVSTAADGRTFVTLSDGATADVTVKASANGMAVVTGVTAGDVVLLPAS